MRRCASCGLDLGGKVSYPIHDLHYCTTVHCLSKGFNDNIHTMEPSMRERVGRRIQDMQIQNIRRHCMESVYGVGTTL